MEGKKCLIVFQQLWIGPLQLNLMFLGPNQPMKYQNVKVCSFSSLCIGHMSNGNGNYTWVASIKNVAIV